MADCLSPSARRTVDFLSPSATRIADSLFPSASRTIALLDLSADICFTIASCTSAGGLISLISTFVTLMPHLSVTSSSFVRRTLLICSLFASSSSSGISPTTALRVVVAIPIDAPVKFWTCTILCVASTTL